MNFCYPLTRFIYECPAIVSPTCVGLAIPRLISLFLLLLQLLRNNNNNFLFSLSPAQCVHHYTTIEMLFGAASPRLDVQRGKPGACGVLGFSQRPTETDCQAGVSAGVLPKKKSHTHAHAYMDRPLFQLPTKYTSFVCCHDLCTTLTHLCVACLSMCVGMGVKCQRGDTY